MRDAGQGITIDREHFFETKQLKQNTFLFVHCDNDRLKVSPGHRNVSSTFLKHWRQP